MAKLTVAKPIEGNSQPVYGYLTINMSVNSSGKLVVSASFANAGLEGQMYTFSFVIYHNGSSNTFTTTGDGSTSFTYTLNKSSNIRITASCQQASPVYLGNGFFVASSSTYNLSLSIPNTAPTVSFYSLPTLHASKTATISWTTSDSDGDTVKTTKLIRYYKASGSSSYSSTTLISSSTTSKSYTDTIPNIIGGSVYYVVTVSDGMDSATATSNTGTVYKSNAAPTGSISVSPSVLYTGKTATISWTTSDSDGDTVTTTKLVRYYKASGASSYSSTTLTTSNVKSYTDTIPKTLAGGSVYYVVTFTDGSATNTVTSSTFTIQQSCNVSVIINGIITEASDVATINNGVITIMDGELHSIISGVIT